MTMKLDRQQMRIMVEIVTSKPESIPATERAVVSELHSLGYIVTRAKRYAVTGRGLAALAISGYQGDKTNIEIQPPRKPLQGRLNGSAGADRAGGAA
jgi:hypothetical protein